MEGRRSRGFLVAFLVSVLVLAAAIGAYLLLGSQNDETPASADTEVSQTPTESEPVADPTPTQSPEPTTPESSPSEEPTASPSPSPSSPSPSPSSTESSPAPEPAGSAEQFASTYYGYLPGDTNAGWRSLAPSFQSSLGGRGSYDGFWSTISGVQVTGVDEVESGVVDVSLVYTKSDGTSEAEVHRLYLEQGGNGYLIVDDDVVG